MKELSVTNRDTSARVNSESANIAHTEQDRECNECNIIVVLVLIRKRKLEQESRIAHCDNNVRSFVSFVCERESVTVTGKTDNEGPAILAKAAEIGADLVIKGGYTQSRLRQMIFGGATYHVLAHSELPVFMAH